MCNCIVLFRSLFYSYSNIISSSRYLSSDKDKDTLCIRLFTYKTVFLLLSNKQQTTYKDIFYLLTIEIWESNRFYNINLESEFFFASSEQCNVHCLNNFLVCIFSLNYLLW